MPELVKRSVESPPGTSEIEGTAVCPCSTKKSMKVLRISLPVIFLVIQTPEDLVLELYQRWKMKDDEEQKVPNLYQIRDLRENLSLTLLQVHSAVPEIGLE